MIREAKIGRKIDSFASACGGGDEGRKAGGVSKVEFGALEVYVDVFEAAAEFEREFIVQIPL